jgi:hypothetical protein
VIDGEISGSRAVLGTPDLRKPILGWAVREKVRTAVEDALLARPAIAAEGDPHWPAVRDLIVGRLLDAGAADSTTPHDIERYARLASAAAEAQGEG